MGNKLIYLRSLFILFGSLLTVFACGQKLSQEEQEYINRIMNTRAQKDSIMMNDPNSPFNFKGKVEFHPLNYFDVDPNFVLTSKLIEYDNKDTVTVFGTKGEQRTAVRYGFLNLELNGVEFQLNIYESIYRDSLKYYSIWFTDKTTNKDSYGVGRYINFELNQNPDHIYTVDFNEAYNPYCAYTSSYSCAIPTKDDHIDVEINAGEKKFHD